MEQHTLFKNTKLSSPSRNNNITTNHLPSLLPPANRSLMQNDDSSIYNRVNKHKNAGGINQANSLH